MAVDALETAGLVKDTLKLDKFLSLSDSRRGQDLWQCHLPPLGCSRLGAVCSDLVENAVSTTVFCVSGSVFEFPPSLTDIVMPRDPYSLDRTPESKRTPEDFYICASFLYRIAFINQKLFSDFKLAKIWSE